MRAYGKPESTARSYITSICNGNTGFITVNEVVENWKRYFPYDLQMQSRTVREATERWESDKPLIVTTNLELDAIRTSNEDNITRVRINDSNDRLLEM